MHIGNRNLWIPRAQFRLHTNKFTLGAIITLIATAGIITVSRGCKPNNGPNQPNIAAATPKDTYVPLNPARCQKNSQPVAIGRRTSARIELCIHWPKGETGANIYLSPEPGGIKKKIASVTRQENSHIVGPISPDADVFLTVKFLSSKKESVIRTQTKFAQAGQGFELDTPIREMFLVRPDVLGVRIAEEYKETRQNSRKWINKFGTDAQKLTQKKWNIVRNNGKRISVRQVHRFSKPVNMGDRLSPRDQIIDIDHTIYLMLDQNVGSNEILHITGPQKIDCLFPFSDYYTKTPAIQVNQVGYMPTLPGTSQWQRWAYIGQWMGDGQSLPMEEKIASFANALVMSTTSTKIPSMVKRNGKALKFPITTRNAKDTSDSSEYILQIDLSTLPADETTRYQIRVPNLGVSYETGVSDTSIFKAYVQTARSLYLNRFGHNVTKKYHYQGPFYPDHSVVYAPDKPYQKENGFFDANTPTTLQTARPLVGGHHDAGDYDIRPQHVKVATDLLAAYETHPEAFMDNQLGIPESGNGVPDLLDEAVWNLRAFRQLQNPDGSIHNGVESYRHPKIGYAHDDPLPYFLHKISFARTITSAALFAWIARLLAPSDLAEASAFENAALAAWKYVQSHPDAQTDIQPCMAFAAGQLYALTGKQEYKTAFDSAFPNAQFVRRYLDGGEAANCKVGSLEYTFGYLQGPSPDAKIAQKIYNKIKTLGDIQKAYVENNYGYRHSRVRGGKCNWGTCTTPFKKLLRTAWLLYLHRTHRPISTQKYHEYLNVLALASDAMFGANPAAQSYTSGLGSRMPTNVLHLDSIAYQNEHGLANGPLPGFTVYGPTSNWSGAAYYKTIKDAFYPNLKQIPHWLRDADAVTNVNGREFAVHSIQAPVVRHLSLLLQPGATLPASWTGQHQNAKAAVPRLAPGETIYSNKSKNTRSPLASTVDSNTPNMAPTVSIDNTFKNKSIMLPDSDIPLHLSRRDGIGTPKKQGNPVTRVILLRATITDDQKTPGPLTMNWTQRSGPTGKHKAVLSDAHAPSTPVLFRQAGNYTFELCVSDAKLKNCDKINIAVKE